MNSSKGQKGCWQLEDYATHKKSSWVSSSGQDLSLWPRKRWFDSSYPHADDDTLHIKAHIHCIKFFKCLRCASRTFIKHQANFSILLNKRLTPSACLFVSTWFYRVDVLPYNNELKASGIKGGLGLIDWTKSNVFLHWPNPWTNEPINTKFW